MNGKRPVPAAQYVRISTKDQQFSIPTQKAAIRLYATGRGFTIVHTYVDSGRSGLDLKHRPGLSELLHDVVEGNCAYKAVFVYDVSRWGRFQDTDEAAHYEFVCKKAGIPVYYCVEQFNEEDKLTTSVLKAMKRTMAGEFSRELSVKCFEGQQRLVKLGFRAGGRPGYGLRRMVVSSDGKRQRILKSGEYKSLSNDRIILVPGPKVEVECVRTIYAMVLRNHMGPTEIARHLNNTRIAHPTRDRWERYMIEDILTNPRYVGSNVWNRTSRKLHTTGVTNSPDNWVIKVDAFASIIKRSSFDRVQAVLPRLLRWSDQDLLNDLRRLLKRHKKLSTILVAQTPGMASPGTYYRRFGGFRRAYGLIGYGVQAGRFDKAHHKLRTLLLRDILIHRLTTLFPEELTLFHHPHDMRPILRLDNGFEVSVRLCRRLCSRDSGARWRFYRGSARQLEDANLVCLFNRTNSNLVKYYLVRGIYCKKRERILRADDPQLDRSCLLDKLSDFYAATTALCKTTGGMRHGLDGDR